MAKKTTSIPSTMPSYDALLIPTFSALKELGGSGSNDEILDQVIKDLNLPDKTVDFPHNGSTSQTELSYRLAWARTYLRMFGAIENSSRSVWAVRTDFTHDGELDAKEIVQKVRQLQKKKGSTTGLDNEADAVPTSATNIELPEESEPWRTKLSTILQNMNPYGFERLAQRILRVCSLDPVVVTKKSGDGGIDGFGKLKVNGIFSFNVAFQCKRYSGVVGAPAVRDFRGSLTTDIEKALLITTGSFSKAAKDEASITGKQQIDLIDGEDLIDLIIEKQIGVKTRIYYDVDEEFFNNI